MEYRDLIINALDYYDRCVENSMNLKLIGGSSNIEFQITDDETKHNKIICTDEHGNKTEFFYEFIGKYLLEHNTWVWGWSMPEIEKKSSNLSKRVLNYGIDMVITKESKLDVDMALVKIALINSRVITSIKEVEILCGIFLYFTKLPYIYIYPNKDNDMYSYLTLIPVV